MTALLNNPMIPAALAGFSILLMIGSVWSAAPWLVAIIGRQRVESEINKLKRKGAVVMHHMHLPDKKGESTYIEHLVITNKRIICLEKIGYAGNIYGSLRDARWAAESSKGSHRFDNPIRHQDAMRGTVTAILGTRLDVEPISVFTAGKLHGDYGHHIVEAGQLGHVLEHLAEGELGGAKLTWARNILNNLAIHNEEEQVATQMFLAKQGSEGRLKLARQLIAVSGVAMLLAVALVLGHHFTQS
jgi:hypothetical protein